MSVWLLLAVLAAAALMAAGIPARRAAMVDPLIALHYESSARIAPHLQRGTQAACSALGSLLLRDVLT